MIDEYSQVLIHAETTIMARSYDIGGKSYIPIGISECTTRFMTLEWEFFITFEVECYFNQHTFRPPHDDWKFSVLHVRTLVIDKKILSYHFSDNGFNNIERPDCDVTTRVIKKYKRPKWIDQDDSEMETEMEPDEQNGVLTASRKQIQDDKNHVRLTALLNRTDSLLNNPKTQSGLPFFDPKENCVVRVDSLLLREFLEIQKRFVSVLNETLANAMFILNSHRDPDPELKQKEMEKAKPVVLSLSDVDVWPVLSHKNQQIPAFEKSRKGRRTSPPQSFASYFRQSLLG